MLRDLRFALHLLVKDRWYSAVAIVALSLGIGVNATVFTLVDAALIRSLPFPDAAHLYVLGYELRPGLSSGISHADLDDWRAQARSFSGFAGFNVLTVNLSDDVTAPQQARSSAITPNMFGLVGQQPLLGRDFAPGDDRPGAPPVALIGAELWKTRYASDPSILGRTIRINAEPHTIVGVMPEGMEFPSNTQLWTPAVRTKALEPRNMRYMAVVARLRPQVPLSQAHAEMNGIAARLAQAYPDTNGDYRTVSIETFAERFNGPQVRVIFLSMMGAVGFVLLIACANVANLLLSRSVHRVREIAVRVAIGATRWRIVRQLLVESVLLGILSGVGGFGLALIGVHLFDEAVANTGKPYWMVFQIDYRVLAFLAVVCVTTGVLFGFAPALQVTRTNVNNVLKEGGRGTAGTQRARWMTSTMVVLELALTLVLLVGAGLMTRSFLKLYTMNFGYTPDHLVAMQMRLPEVKYRDADSRRAFFDRLTPELAALPGADAVTLTTSVPPFNAATREFEREGVPVDRTAQHRPDAAVVHVAPSFFNTLGVQLLRGRALTERDGAPGAETALVNERFASEYFGGQDPIGRRIRFVARPTRDAPATEPWRTIVGITPTLRHGSFQDSEAPAAVYVPYREEAPAAVTLLVRSHADPGLLLNAVRMKVQSIDPDQPVFSARTLDEMLWQQMWPYRVFGAIFAIFAAIALAMSSLGLYAVMAYSVEQRTAEIGVRMALGAEGWQVWWLVLRRAILQLALGLAIGLGSAIALSRVLSTFLVQISATDPLTFVVISGVLAIVAIVACIIPARRATRVDPLVALRNE